MTKSIATLGILVAATAIPGYADPLVEPNYDHVDTSRWRCRLCPFDLATAARGRWHLGTLAVDDAHPRFGRDNGLDEARSYVDANAELTSRGGDGRYLLFDGADLGVDARQAELRAGHDARYGVVVQWREVPRNVATDGRTPYTGRTTLELPDSWIIARAATPDAAAGRHAVHEVAGGHAQNCADGATQREPRGAADDLAPDTQPKPALAA